MKNTINKTIALFVGLSFCSVFFTQASVIIGNTDYFFSNGGLFDGDGGTDTAGPFFDAATGVSFDITTETVSGRASILNENSGVLGIGASSPHFEGGDSWFFKMSEDVEFLGIDLSSIDEDEALLVTSPDWIGLSITPGSLSVLFDSAAGHFILLNGVANDDFDLNDLSGGVALPVSAGTTIGFEGTSGNVGTLQDFTLLTIAPPPAPEPSTLGLLGLGVLFIRVRRRLEKKGSFLFGAVKFRKCKGSTARKSGWKRAGRHRRTRTWA